MLKLMLKKMGERAWTGLNWFRIGTSGRACEQGMNFLISVKCAEFFII